MVGAGRRDTAVGRHHGELSASIDDGSLIAFGVNGAANINNPWDTNASLPASPRPHRNRSGDLLDRRGRLFRLPVPRKQLRRRDHIALDVARLDHNAGGGLWSTCDAFYEQVTSAQSGASSTMTLGVGDPVQGFPSAIYAVDAITANTGAARHSCCSRQPGLARAAPRQPRARSRRPRTARWRRTAGSLSRARSRLSPMASPALVRFSTSARAANLSASGRAALVGEDHRHNRFRLATRAAASVVSRAAISTAGAFVALVAGGMAAATSRTSPRGGVPLAARSATGTSSRGLGRGRRLAVDLVRPRLGGGVLEIDVASPDPPGGQSSAAGAGRAMLAAVAPFAAMATHGIGGRLWVRQPRPCRVYGRECAAADSAAAAATASDAAATGVAVTETAPSAGVSDT